MLRRLVRFERRDGLEYIKLPQTEARFSTSQILRGKNFSAAGQDYPIRMTGLGPGLKDIAMESMDFVLASRNRCPGVIDGKWETLVEMCHSFGVGKLWSRDDLYDERWAWAYLSKMPDREHALSFNARHMQIQLTFGRLSDWFGETETGEETISASPTNFDIVNPGLRRAGSLIIRLRSNGVGGFDNPTLSNGIGSQTITIAKEADFASSEIRIRAANNVVEYSNDDGANYANIYDLVTLGDGQAHVMEVLRGTNPMIYTQPSGTPDLTIEWSFDPAWSG